MVTTAISVPATPSAKAIQAHRGAGSGRASAVSAT